MIAMATMTMQVAVYATNCWHQGWGGPWLLLGPLFWGLVIFGIVWAVCRSRRRRRRSGFARHGSGIQLLERRYAQGELSADEFRERRAVLEEHRSAPGKAEEERTGRVSG
jgi:putative membrane protein